MVLSPELVQKLDALLGVSSQPHSILIQGEWIDTGCLKWTGAPTPEDVWGKMDPQLFELIKRWWEFSQNFWQTVSRDLINSLERWQEIIFEAIPNAKDTYMKGSPGYDLIVEKKTGEYLTRLTPKQRADFDELFSQLGDKTTLYRSTYKNGTTITDTIAEIKAREFLAKEPPELWAEFDKYMFGAKPEMYYPTQGFSDATLYEVREVLKELPVIAYWSNSGLSEFRSTIAVAPTTDQYNILRYEQTDGVNYELLTEDIIEQLKLLDEKYGIDIIGANQGGVDLILKRIPKGKEARELGEWLLNFCPELYEAPRKFPGGKVSLMWN